MTLAFEEVRGRNEDEAPIAAEIAAQIDAFGKAFIEGGAKAYIASAGYPDGAATPLFVHMLFYELLVGKSSLEDALSLAATIDDDGDLAFALFKQ